MHLIYSRYLTSLTSLADLFEAKTGGLIFLDKATAAKTADVAPMPKSEPPSEKGPSDSLSQEMERLEAKIRSIDDKAKQRSFIKSLTEATRLALEAWTTLDFDTSCHHLAIILINFDVCSDLFLHIFLLPVRLAARWDKTRLFMIHKLDTYAHTIMDTHALHANT